MSHHLSSERSSPVISFSLLFTLNLFCHLFYVSIIKFIQLNINIIFIQSENLLTDELSLLIIIMLIDVFDIFLPFYLVIIFLYCHACMSFFFAPFILFLCLLLGYTDVLFSPILFEKLHSMLLFSVVTLKF